MKNRSLIPMEKELFESETFKVDNTRSRSFCFRQEKNLVSEGRNWPGRKFY